MGEIREGFGVLGCRSFSVGNYVIFFRPIDSGIEVARVIHGSRDKRNIELPNGFSYDSLSASLVSGVNRSESPTWFLIIWALDRRDKRIFGEKSLSC
jgi:hypothetical protein